MLDIDETLINSFEADRDDERFRDFSIQGPFWRSYKRPGVDSFLQEVASKFEVVLYTLGVDFYAKNVAENLDPTGKLLHPTILSASRTQRPFTCSDET